MVHGFASDATVLQIESQQGPGWGVGRVYSHVKEYRDVPPKWVTFSPKILRHGSHFGPKKSLGEGPI